MEEFLNKIINKDCLQGMSRLPDNSVDCCVTSPPYYGLRDYGVDGQMGLEETLEEYIEVMVNVFTEVKRVLKPEGTLWLNIGDSYYGSYKGQKDAKKVNLRNKGCVIGNFLPPARSELNMKPKDLMGVPWLLAFALRSTGYYLRRDIIWYKKNPMPESVKDRPTTSHEYIFLLSKSAKYYYDQEAILEDCSESTHARMSQDIANQKGSLRAFGGTRADRPMKTYVTTPKAQKAPSGWDTDKGNHNGKTGRYPKVKNNESFDLALRQMPEKRNKRSVWDVASEAFSEAHFATFPQKLIIDCIKAGSPRGGVILDPFMGAGTTAIVARKLDRNYIGFELNPHYIKIAEKRLYEELGMYR